MVEHTPGPWDFIKGDARWFVRAAGMDIASVGTVPYWENFKPVDEANARLIAAAPDLLAALEGVMGSLPNHELPKHRGHYCRESNPCLNCQARDAIEAAKS